MTKIFSYTQERTYLNQLNLLYPSQEVKFLNKKKIIVKIAPQVKSLEFTKYQANINNDSPNRFKISHPIALSSRYYPQFPLTFHMIP